MASIIKTSINLDLIDKSKIYVGKKGKYLPVTITLNDELDNFGLTEAMLPHHLEMMLKVMLDFKLRVHLKK